MGDLGNMHTKRIWKIWSFMEERNKINNSTFVPTSESSFFSLPSQESIVILLMLLLIYLRIHGISNACLSPFPPLTTRRRRSRDVQLTKIASPTADRLFSRC